MNKTMHTMKLPLDAQAGVPEWIHIFPAGKFYGRDGRGPYELTDPAKVIASSLEQAVTSGIPMDYDHQLEHVATNGQPAVASGWLTDLEARETGIWGKVDWTDKARAHVEAREYRYVSPVFYHQSGQVRAIESVALTNLPNFHLKALANKETSKETNKETSMSKVAEFLGLPEDADETVLLEAIEKKIAAAVQAALQAAEKEQASKQPDPGQYIPKPAYDTLAKELASLKDWQRDMEANNLMEAAKLEGKITPALEDWAKSYARADPQGFKAWAAASPNLRPGDSLNLATPPVTKDSLSSQEKEIAQKCGLSAEMYQKGKDQ